MELYRKKQQEIQDAKDLQESQKKFVVANITSGAFAQILSFSNLVVGQWYEIKLKSKVSLNTNVGFRHHARHNGSDLFVIEEMYAGSTSSETLTKEESCIFQATTTTLEIFKYHYVGTTGSESGSGITFGDNTTKGTYAEITPLQNYQPSTGY